MYYMRDTDARGVPVGPRYGACEHAKTARANALVHAAARGCIVQVETDTRVVFHAQPNGRITPPPNVIVDKRERCVAGTGRVCFCSPCRAARKNELDDASQPQ